MDFKNNWRIWLLVLAVVLSLALVGTKGLSFGIDFSGGTELKMELEEGGQENIDFTTRILKERLNGMGLKSVQVLPEVDKKHITIKVSSTDPEELENVRTILHQQAFFEQFVEGELCSRGDEIYLDVARPGGSSDITGSRWSIYVKTRGAAPQRCGLAMKDKEGRMTDLFLDRPKESVIVLSEDLCNLLGSTDFANNQGDIGYTQMEFLETRANISVLCYNMGSQGADEDDEPDEEEPEPEADPSILDELGIVFEDESGAANATNTTNGTQEVEEPDEPIDNAEVGAQLRALAEAGKKGIITTASEISLPPEIREVIGDFNMTVRVVPKEPSEAFHSIGTEDSWIEIVTGLKSTLTIQEGLTHGTPIDSSVFTGGASSPEEARKIVDAYEIWLTSGNLPIKINIVMEKPNLPEFGARFLNYSVIIGLIAIILVGAVIAVRYREPKISIFIVSIGLSELILILGFASLVSWELDLAAVAGIIAAIGTGVDHQVVITDETLRGERPKGEERKIWDVKGAINRAFFIIFTAAATTVVAMLPLMSIIDLKGFAFTTIIGVLIGIMITRPAYARIVELIT